MRVIDVGNSKQLMLDHGICEQSKNIRMVMNRPKRTGEAVIVPSEQEKEMGFSIGSYSSLLHENGRFRLWYFASSSDNSFRRLCYAESEDGVSFSRPRVENNGGLSPHNAVLGDPVQGGCVWIDPHAPAHQRYRSQAKWGPLPDDKYSGKLFFYASPDGIKWEKTHHLAIGDCDTQTVIFFDERFDRYVMYTRRWVRFDDRNLSRRKVRRLESDDLVHWENETVVMEADEADMSRWETSTGKPPVDYYGACVFKYPGADDFYVMISQPFWHWRDRPEEEKWGFSPDPENMDQRIIHLGPAVIDARLAYSRDGIGFRHAVDRGPFLDTGQDGAFDSRRVWVLPDPVVTDEEIWFYYSGTNRDHDGFTDPAAGKCLSGIGRAVMRLDGFVSAECDCRGGWFITPSLTFNPGTLELNVAASAGGAVRVEVLDAENQPVCGYSGKDSSWLCGNSVRLPVRWEKGEIGNLAGKTVKLKFHLREAKLYAFQVAPDT